MWEILTVLFDWVVRASIYAVAAIAVIVLIQLLMRRALPARWSYTLWMVLLVRMILPAGPVSNLSVWNIAPELNRWSPTEVNIQDVIQKDLTSQSPVNVSQSVESSIPSAYDDALIHGNSGETKAPDSGTVPTLESFLQTGWKLLPGIWLAGALAFMIVIAVNNLRLWNSVHKLPLVTEQVPIELLEECKKQMKVQSAVGLVVTDRIKSPSLLGCFRPRILLPEGLIGHIPLDDLRHIFLHELAHLKRCDIPVGWIIGCLQSLHWFNPLIWWAFYRMHADREVACDALVLSRLQSGESHSYAGTLVSLLERFNHVQHLPTVAGILENRTELKRRLTMIAKFKRPTRIAGILAVALVVALSGILLTEASDEAYEVEQTIRDMAQTLLEGDLESWAEFYVQDDTFSTILTNDVHVVGFDYYKDYFKGWFERNVLLEHTYLNMDVHLSGDMAWVIINDVATSNTVEGDRPKEYRGLGTFILVKRDGRWLINHYNVRYTPYIRLGPGPGEISIDGADRDLMNLLPAGSDPY